VSYKRAMIGQDGLKPHQKLMGTSIQN